MLFGNCVLALFQHLTNFTLLEGLAQESVLQLAGRHSRNRAEQLSEVPVLSLYAFFDFEQESVLARVNVTV